jgi:hypothetical protein
MVLCSENGKCPTLPLLDKCACCKVMAGMDAHQALLERRARTGLYKRERRKVLLSMRPEQRKVFDAAELATARSNRNINDQSVILENGATPTFLALPLEVRWIIYDCLFGCHRKIDLLTTKMPQRSKHSDLSLVCQQLRAEVDRHFLEKQTYVFINVPAMKKWCTKDQAKVTTMRSVALCFNTPMLLLNDTFAREAFQHLKELEIGRNWHALTSKSYRLRPECDEEVRKSYLPLGNPARFKNYDTLLAWRQPEIILQCLPQFHNGAVEWAPTPRGYSVRFRVHDFKLSPCVQTNNNSWTPIVVTVSDGSCPSCCRVVNKSTGRFLYSALPARKSMRYEFFELKLG